MSPSPPPQRPLDWKRTLAWILGAALVALWQNSAPGGDAPEGVDAAEVQRLASELTRNGPRPSGSPANLEARASIQTHLRALRLETEEQTAWTCGANGTCAQVTNVLARVKGTRPTPALLLSAHHDTVRAGPGAGDDTAGVAVLLHVAGLLAAAQPPQDVVLLFTDGEELGLLGAQAFVHHRWAQDVGAMVNLEARGNSGPAVLFETRNVPEDAWSTLSAVLPHPVTHAAFNAVYRLLPNDTDLSVLGSTVPALNLALIGDAARYHTPADRAELLPPKSLGHLAHTVLRVARQPLPWGTPGGAAFHVGVPPLGVLGLPEGLVRVLGWLLPAVLALLVLALNARRHARLVDMLRVLFTLLVALPAVLLVDALLVRLFRVAGASTAVFVEPWVALQCALVLVGVGLLGSLTAGLLERTSLAARVGAVSLLLGNLFMLTGSLVPEAIPTGIPMLVLLGAACGVLALGRVLPSWVLPMASASGVVALGPLMVLGPQAVGLRVMPVVAMMVAAACLPLLGAAAPEDARAWRRRSRLAWLAGGVLLGVAMAQQPFTVDTPAQVNLVALWDDEGGHLVAETRLAELPEPTRQRFANAPTQPFEWDPSIRGFRAPLPEAAPAAPELQVLQHTAGRITARFRSLRGAPMGTVWLPPGVLKSATVQGVPVEHGAWKAVGGVRALAPLTVATLPPQGVELVLDVGTEPVEVLVSDTSDGLPAQALDVRRTAAPFLQPERYGDRTVVVRRMTLGGPGLPAADAAAPAGQDHAP